MSDGELLRAYGLEGSEAAFTELVNRYVNLVYSVAQRHLADRSLSEEVTQTVFVLLARKAPSLLHHPSLAGWLHRAAWNLAAKTARTEARRRRWERQADPLPPPVMSDDPSETAPVLPVLDEALQELNDPDRAALVLRYFLGKPLREVGEALGTSEAAAKMRVSRALERLRTLLIQRGITCSPGALAAVISGQAVVLAPPTLAARVVTAAAHPGSGLVSLSDWVHGVFILMKGTKLTALIIAAALLAVLSTLTVRKWRTEKSPVDGTESPPAVEEATEGPERLGLGGRLRPADPSAPALAPLDLEAARQRLREALAVPVPKSGITWPEPSVLEAMTAFGDRQEEVFAVLKEAFLDPTWAEEEKKSLAHSRALSAMGELGKEVPGLLPFLWETTDRGDGGDRVMALMALQKLGLEPSDLPALTRLLPDSRTGESRSLQHILPLAIRHVYQRNPKATAPYLTELVGVLEGATDPLTQFGAACALLGTPPGVDPRVIEIIRNGLHEGLDAPPFDQRRSNVPIAIKNARDAGDMAKPLIPDLLEVARLSSEAEHRNAALLAVGRIQPELRADLPELDQALVQDEEKRRVRESVSEDSATHEDLLQALRDPLAAVPAATILGEAGLNLPEVVPALIAALAEKDEDSRDQIVEAIYKIDPQVEIKRVPDEVVRDGLEWAHLMLAPRHFSEKDNVTRLLLHQNIYTTWRTREELLDLVKNLAASDVPIARAFVKGLAEKDPGLADRAQQLIDSSRP